MCAEVSYTLLRANAQAHTCKGITLLFANTHVCKGITLLRANTHAHTSKGITLLFANTRACKGITTLCANMHTRPQISHAHPCQLPGSKILLANQQP